MLKVEFEKCNGDGVCTTICPVGAAGIDKALQKANIDNEVCIECFSCMNICSQGAICESNE